MNSKSDRTHRGCVRLRLTYADASVCEKQRRTGLWHHYKKSSPLRRFIFVTVHANNVIKTYLWRTYDKILIVIFVASHLLHGDALVFFVTDRVTSMMLSPPSLIYFSRCSSGHVYDGDVYDEDVDTCLTRRLTCVLFAGWHMALSCSFMWQHVRWHSKTLEMTWQQVRDDVATVT